MRSWLTALLLLTIFLPSRLHADVWPGWRGPDSNGVARGTGYATDWDSKKNVAWKAAIPGNGGSTPAVWDERVFVTTPAADKNGLVCLDLKTGREKWTAAIGDDRGAKHKHATGANPSPVTDGQHVFAYFKSGDVGCFDMSGKQVWHKNTQDLFGEDTLWWDLGTSPVLTKNAVVIACMQSGPSYLVAFDKQTGKVLWKQDRSLNAPVEANHSYSTPVVIEYGGMEQIVVLGADHVTAHDARDGKELWRCGGLNPENNKYFRSISGPVVLGDHVLAPYARGNSLSAVRMGGTGDVTSSHVDWVKQLGADVPTPAAADGRVYVCSDKGEISCLNAGNGEKIWSGRVEKSRHPFRSSPVLADGHLYATRSDGKTFVLSLGDDFKVVARNELDEFMVATPVFVDGRILLRTGDHVYCIKAQ